MASISSLWKQERESNLFKSIEDKTYNYFDRLDTDEKTEIVIGTEVIKLDYREGQHNFALEFLETIKKNKVLLIQAGVGIGKSYGYLIPVFYTIDGLKNTKNIRFNKVVISTSNIALQYQLIKDIDRISKMLDIPIKAVIAKGINNYACIDRIEKAINSRFTSLEKKEQLKKILGKIYKNESCDKTDLIDVSENVWKSVQLRSRGYCSKCSYSKYCSFYKTEQYVLDSNIVITNHANYISNSSKWDIDCLVIDEAHKFDENLINILKNELKLKNIISNLDRINYFISRNIYDEYSDLNDYFDNIKKKFMYLFAYIKRSANVTFTKNNRNNNSITDGDRMSFTFNGDIMSLIKEIRKELESIFETLNNIDGMDKFQREEKESIINYFKDLDNIFKDMLSYDRKNIYWVSFFNEDSINLGYVPKDRSYITKKIFEQKIPILLTSATLLDSNNSYNYFINKLGIDKINRTVEQAEEELSPYDYDNNALFYYDKNVSVPNDKENNIVDLALKISELIRITEGKALVLFTSKQRMKDVYNLMMKDEFSFKVLIQSDNNSDMIKEEFENDTDACLFATGSFWEGISIKGKSLSNLIITHLPFDNVDAINKSEAGKYVNKYDKLKYVYIPDMLVKMKQAIGRLIRSDDDTGIVCCLDSRMEYYLEEIKNVSPIKTITTDIKDVYEFSDRMITNRSRNYIKVK